jgi:hypothetical protein
MVTPDPRRGDEPGDPDVTPGKPNPDNDNPRNDPHPSKDDQADD